MFLATLVTEMMVNSSWKETSHKYSCGSFSNLSEAAVCSSPSPSAGSHSAAVSPSAEAHVMICGSQDWLATWGRHWEMTRGPVGVWLSRQSPLTRCCRTEPLGFHFCGGGKKKKRGSDVPLRSGLHSQLINHASGQTAHVGWCPLITVRNGWPSKLKTDKGKPNPAGSSFRSPQCISWGLSVRSVVYLAGTKTTLLMPCADQHLPSYLTFSIKVWYFCCVF